MLLLIDYLPNAVFYLLTGVAFLGLFFSYVWGKIPFVGLYSKPVEIACALAFTFGVYMIGAISNEERWQLRIKEAQVKIAQLEAKSAEETVRVVTKYVEKVKIIKEKGDVIIKEVPKYITADDDAKCTVPNGFVVLHDSAAKNEVPDSTRGTNETTSGVKLSTIAETVAGNYSACHQNSEQLKSLQEWIRTQEKLLNGD